MADRWDVQLDNLGIEESHGIRGPVIMVLMVEYIYVPQIEANAWQMVLIWALNLKEKKSALKEVIIRQAR